MADLFYEFVPRGIEENLQYRLDLRLRAREDEGFRRALWIACKEDVLYFFSSFAWVYEPRDIVVDGVLVPRQLPMIPWSHQEEPIRQLKANLGKRDIGIKKSRSQGVTWIADLLALHDWIFTSDSKISLVSSTEDKTDNPENPDSLFWKLDWELTKLPKWMIGERDKDWKRNLSQHTLVNLHNNSRITGYACTGDLARGGRCTWFLMDEMGSWPDGPDEDAMRSTQQVTKSRLVVSTPEGTKGAFYRCINEPSNMLKLTIDWRDNPWQNRGLYKHVHGRMVPLDPVNNPLPPHYEVNSQDVMSRLRTRGFKLAGETRSPWYDNECDRANATPQSIAKELDMDFGGSMFRIFGTDFMDKAQPEIRHPVTRGIMSYHPESLEPEFERSSEGTFLLWCALDSTNNPPPHSYVLGADVSTGLGGSYTSNSTIIVIDTSTMEQVAEYASNTTAEEDWADLAMAVGYWFNNAYLVVERNGPGNRFVKRLISKRYPNLYHQKIIFKKTRGGKNASKSNVGWWTGKDTKEAMFGELKRSVTSGELKLRSKALVEECSQYVRVGGKIVHVQAAATDDDSSMGEAHGDRVIGACVCLQGVRDRPLPVKQPTEEDKPAAIPKHCMAARFKEYQEQEERASSGWDDRSNWDMMRN